ncbi:aspartyl/asparaginyl beta-hydroxylase [Acrasis kona]|uniref:Aspartyl/asparaginyl beta-hydroxylase n=1 Tax=Acrasis kona TaxID=1008807 RepID=A0AAW2Z2X1_9EUKA
MRDDDEQEQPGTFREFLEMTKKQEQSVDKSDESHRKKTHEVDTVQNRYNNDTPDEVTSYYLSNRDVGKKCFYDHKDHPYLDHIASSLVKNFEVIERELMGILNQQLTEFTKWPESICKTGWKVFGLYGFGRRLEENIVRCPETTKIIESLIPENEITTVGFSSLEPGAYITPHKGYEGYSDNVLRLHLGIIIPQPNERCAIKVGNITKKWKRREVLIFDDFLTHEAWNLSDQVRVNLLLDLKYTEKDYMTNKRVRTDQVDCQNADFSGGLRNLLSNIDSSDVIK